MEHTKIRVTCLNRKYSADIDGHRCSIESCICDGEEYITCLELFIRDETNIPITKVKYLPRLGAVDFNAKKFDSEELKKLENCGLQIELIYEEVR